MSLSERVGHRIRSFRKARGISIAELSARTGKSQATLYKYETGQISPDIETLGSIANVLKTEPTFLLDAPRLGVHAAPSIAYLSTGKLYAYYYDGRIKSLVKSLLTFYHQPTDDTWHVTFYMNVKNFDDPENARYLYVGTPIFHETVSFFIMENQTLPIETFVIELVHPMQTLQTTWGLFMGLSDEPVAPMATKMLFSRKPLTDKELASYPLAFTKEQLKSIRMKNALLLSIRESEENTARSKND